MDSTDFNPIKRNRELTNTSRALHWPSPCSSTRSPCPGFVSAAGRLQAGEAGCKEPALPFWAGQSCAWVCKVEKRRTDLVSGLFCAGEAALVLPAAAAGGMLGARPRCSAPRSALPAASLRGALLSSSLRALFAGRWGRTDGHDDNNGKGCAEGTFLLLLF